MRRVVGFLPIPRKLKQGFILPDQSWYRGPTRSYIFEVLLGPPSLQRGYIKPAYMRQVVEGPLSGRINRRLLLWPLFWFEWWKRIFMDRDPESWFSPIIALHGRNG